MKKSLERPSEEDDNFISSVILVIFLPLLPLLLEFLLKKEMPSDSAALTASFFALALGSSSKVKSFFALSIFNGVLFSAAYIIVLSKININSIQIYSYVSISIFAILHGAERYIRHIKDGDPFLDLWYGKEDIEKNLMQHNLNNIKNAAENDDDKRVYSISSKIDSDRKERNKEKIAELKEEKRKKEMEKENIKKVESIEDEDKRLDLNKINNEIKAIDSQLEQLSR